MDQDPGLAIFVGDLMDGGREWEDDVYVSYINELRIDGFPSISDLKMYFLLSRESESVLRSPEIMILVSATEFVQLV